jgi:hypothetical protein
VLWERRTVEGTGTREGVFFGDLEFGVLFESLEWTFHIIVITFTFLLYVSQTFIVLLCYIPFLTISTCAM